MHALLIAIEGVDGAGKRTLCDGVRAAFEGNTGRWPACRSRATTIRWPPTSPPRRCTASTVTWRPRCTRWPCCSRSTGPAPARRSGSCAPHTTSVILDRYVASNAAYSAARLRQDATGEAVDWVRRLEYERLHMPAPDWQVLLDVPAELAADRARHRAA